MTSSAIPVFPLGTVLFPGVVLPLHIFEPRYRQLVRDLMEHDGPREFGVLGIKQGYDTGDDGVRAMYTVGCTAELRQVSRHDDGRFDIVTVGRKRFRTVELDRKSRPYLCATVDFLAEETTDPDEATVLAGSVREAFAHFRQVLRTQYGGGEDPAPATDGGGLPDDPAALSFLVAANASLALDDRQALLVLDDTVERLRRELRLLKHEAAMLTRLQAVPVPLADLRVQHGPN